MTKLDRVTAKVFADSAAANEIGQFGSAVAGSKLETADVATIQALSAWLDGWSEALVSGNRYPALQEMNGAMKVLSYQGAYALQEGIPEYDSATTYYIGSIVKKTGTFELYGSITDDNVGNALIDDSNWEFLGDLNNINSLSSNYIRGLLLSNGVDLNNDIDISSGECKSSDNTTDIRLNSTITKQIDANWTEGNNAGGFPSGLILSSDTWYHLFVIYNPTTKVTDAGFDTSLTASNLLSDAVGYTKYRRIGGIATDGSSNILKGYWKEISGGGIDFTWEPFIISYSATSGVPTTYTDLTLATPPGIVVKAKLQCNFRTSSAVPQGLALQSKGTSDGRYIIVNTNSDSSKYTPAEIYTNTSAVIQHFSDTATPLEYFIRTIGYIDWRIS